MCDNFHYGRFYDSHKRATLDPVEQDIIASSTVPIHVFWNSLLRIQHPERWPQDRKFVSWSSKSATGLFVTYQSNQDPLPTLGRLGDIWVTTHCVYYKEAENTWTPWRQGSPFYCCPYEEQRVLTWLRSAHFTYNTVASRKKERTRWQAKGIPQRCIPEKIRTEFPAIDAVSSKRYDDLSAADCAFLLSIRCDLLRDAVAPLVQQNPALHVQADTQKDYSEPIQGQSSTSEVMNIEPLGNGVDCDFHQDYAGTSGDLQLDLQSQPEPTQDQEYASTFGARQPDSQLQTQPTQDQDCIGTSNADHAIIQLGSAAHEPNPALKYQRPPDHRASGGVAVGPDGMHVFLPYYDKNRVEEPENVASCKWLVSGVDGTAPFGEGLNDLDKLPRVTVMDGPVDKEDRETTNKIVRESKHIASFGRVTMVLNAGEGSGPSGWDEENLIDRTSRALEGEVMEWQSELYDQERREQGLGLETVKGSLGEFITAELDPKDIVNCLDTATVGSQPPWFLHKLADSNRVINSSSGLTLEFSTEEPIDYVAAAATPAPPSTSAESPSPVAASSAPPLTSPRDLSAAAATSTSPPTSTDKPSTAVATPTHPLTSAGHPSSPAAAPSSRYSFRKRPAPPSAHPHPPNKKAKGKAAVQKKTSKSAVTRKKDNDTPLSLDEAKKKAFEEILLARFTEINAQGAPLRLEFDVIKAISWMLLASSAAMTQLHYDASGYLTWIRNDTGRKIWGFAVQIAYDFARDEEEKEAKAEAEAKGEIYTPPPREKLTALQIALKDYQWLATHTRDPQCLSKYAKPVRVCIPPGAVVIQPPGALHLVYTLERSIFTGGHFFLYCTMHLTEVARACSAYTGQVGTNASHPGALRVLSRMMLSLAEKGEKSALRKPFISHARMLLWSQIYAPGDQNPADPEFKPDQESLAEHAAAQSVAEAILYHNNISLDDIRPEPLERFRWLSSIGEGSDWSDWRDPGTVHLVLPDLKPYFRSNELMIQQRKARAGRASNSV